MLNVSPVTRETVKLSNLQTWIESNSKQRIWEPNPNKTQTFLCLQRTQTELSRIVAFGRTQIELNPSSKGSFQSLKLSKIKIAVCSTVTLSAVLVSAWRWLCTAEEFIIGRVIKAMNTSWHPNCFLCELCDAPLADAGFIKSAGRSVPVSAICRQQEIC